VLIGDLTIVDRFASCRSLGIGGSWRLSTRLAVLNGSKRGVASSFTVQRKVYKSTRRKSENAMYKFESIYRQLLLSSMMGTDRVTQEELARRCNVSLGLVNKTIRKLSLTLAVEATSQGVRVLSPGRVLNLWATERNVDKDLLDSFRLDDLRETERSLPSGVVMTAFSAWKSLSGKAPAEYDRLYFYVIDQARFKDWVRFREPQRRSTNPNIFALITGDKHLTETAVNSVACVPQVYVDIYSVDGPPATPYLRDIIESYPQFSIW